MFEAEMKRLPQVDLKKRKRKHSDSDSETFIDAKQCETAILIRRILESISDLVKECEINATDDGLTIQVMDPLHASICDVFISKKLFEKYRCDRDVRMGIKLKDFLKILRAFRFEKNYLLKFSSKDEGTTLTIEYSGDGAMIKFDVNLYTLNLEKYSFPEQVYDVEVEMLTSDFMVVPRIIGTFDDHITLEAKDKVLVFSQGGETTTSNLFIKENDDTKLNIGCALKKEIAMKYVSSIAKVMGLSKNMKICMGEKTPVFFEFGLQEGGYIRFFIAPKMEDEE
ncbi:proliferating cell nuclear antigen [Gurleya vavrai]